MILDAAPTGRPLARRSPTRASRSSASTWRARRSSARGGSRSCAASTLRAADGERPDRRGRADRGRRPPRAGLGAAAPARRRGRVRRGAGRLRGRSSTSGSRPPPRGCSPAATSPATGAPRRRRAPGAAAGRALAATLALALLARRRLRARGCASTAARRPPRPSGRRRRRRRTSNRRRSRRRARHARERRHCANRAAPLDPGRRLEAGARQALRQDAGRNRLERDSGQVRTAGAGRPLRRDVLPGAEPDDRRARSVAHAHHRTRAPRSRTTSRRWPRRERRRRHAAPGAIAGRRRAGRSR